MWLSEPHTQVAAFWEGLHIATLTLQQSYIDTRMGHGCASEQRCLQVSPVHQFLLYVDRRKDMDILE